MRVQRWISAPGEGAGPGCPQGAGPGPGLFSFLGAVLGLFLTWNLKLFGVMS